MKRLLLCATAVLLSVPSLPCAAQDNPWNGSWKVEPGSFHFKGVTYAIATSPTGYTVTMGGKEVGNIDCTGKAVADPSGVVRTCKKTPGGYTSTNTRDGKTTSVIVWKVAADNKTMTRTGHYTPAGEAPYTMTSDYKRVGGTTGFDGSWLETGFSESQDTGILGIQVMGDTISFKETDSPEPVKCKLDGTPTPFGTNTMSVTLLDPHTLKVRYADPTKKIVRENTFALSLDGKEISETDFTADPTPSSMTLVFSKM